MKSSWIVYKHTSPSGKVYIGITHYKNPEKRWQNGKGYKKNLYFTNAINKYGWDNFQHEILYSGISESDAKKIEISLIKKYKEFGIAYNITDGGDGVLGIIRTISTATKKKMSDSAKGRKLSQRTKDKLSAIRKGKKHSKEWNGNISKSHLGVGSKPVLQFSLSGELMAEYTSLTNAEISTGINNGHISKCCKGIRKTAGGFIWKYKS